jgi:predicted GNAT superfamily acetyltransferase
MIEIRTSTFHEMLAYWDELCALFQDHWDEVALNKQVMALKPDMPRYQAMNEQGALVVLGAWDDERLVGYSVNFVMQHLHYADLRICSNDLLFVSQAVRKGRVGLRLIRATEAAAKDAGARLMLWHGKPNTALVEIMPALGYGVQDVIFSKEV